MSELFGGWMDETELVYCPRCGSELSGVISVECPEHGRVSIDYRELGELEDDIFGEPFAGIDDETVERFQTMMDKLESMDEMMETKASGNDTPGIPAICELMFGRPPDDDFAEDVRESDESDPEDGHADTVRDWINRFAGRGN